MKSNSKSKDAKQPDRSTIVEAFKVPWKERKKTWPIELPHPYNIRYQDWVSAIIWEIQGFAATLSIKQLCQFIKACTGSAPKKLDFPTLCNEARKLLDYALTVDPLSGEDTYRATDPVLVSKLWSVDITEETMAKKSKTAKTETPVVEAKAAPAPTKSKKANGIFTPPADLVGMSKLASLQLFQIAEALEEDYGKVPEVVEMVKRVSALSDAFAAWGGVK